MKSLSIFIFGILISQIANAQTTEEIIHRHIEAHGGQERMERINSMQIKGQFTAFSLEKPFWLYKDRSGKYYGQFYIGEFAITEYYDGSQGWTIDPWQDIDYARKISEEEKNTFTQKAEIITPFFRYREKAYEVEFRGITDFDGQEVFELELTRPNGKKEKWFLDTGNYLEVASFSDWTDFAWPMPSESYYDDFRDVDGIVVPFYTERTFGQRNRIHQIEEILFDQDVNEALFSMPCRQEMQKLAKLCGEYEVDVKTMTQRGSWYDLGKTESHIRFNSANLLELEIRYDKILPVIKTIRFSYEENDTFRASIYDELDTRQIFLQGSVSDTLIRFTEWLVPEQTDDQPGKETRRFDIREINDKGFIFMFSSSSDGGLNWRETDRFVYTRK